MIAFGALLTLVLGFWLVSDQDYSFSELWLVLSLILWFVAIGTGQAGGMRDRQTRAARRASSRPASNVATPELRARLRDPRTLALSYGSGVGARRRPRPHGLEAGLVIVASAEAQLFLHILGAITLFGATAAVAVLALVGPQPRGAASARARLVLHAARARDPGVGRDARASATGRSPEMDWPDGAGWIDLGAGVANGGLFVLLAAGGAQLRLDAPARRAAGR